MEILHDIPATVDLESILSQFRIDPESDTGKIFSDTIEAFHPNIRPKAMYTTCYIEHRDEQGVGVGGKRFNSRILSINVAQTERVFPFVVTAGIELDALRLPSDDMLYQYCLDTVKTRVLRHAVKYLRQHLQKKYALQNISMMNPGSLEDWPISEQHTLFSLLGDVQQSIGVRLTESFLMSPVKSVSGIIFPTETTFENCQLCPREDCPGRRTPYDEMLLHQRYAPEKQTCDE